MYISKLFVKNFRSLQQAVISFNAGKNVLVGKNNSGKSNIIKALDLLLGSRFPTSVNFTDNDYYTEPIIDEETGEYTEEIAENIFIEATLEGTDFDEELILSMKKKTAFSQLESIKSLYYKLDDDDEIYVEYNLVQKLDEIEQNDCIVELPEFYNRKTAWKTSSEVLSFLKDNKGLKMFFSTNRTDEELRGFGLIVKDKYDKYWITHFLPQKLRNALVTTAVIGSLRNPEQDLRIVHYTWFGKLIKNIWDRGKSDKYPVSTLDEDEEKSCEDLIAKNTENLKSIIDFVFRGNTEQLRELLTKAISHKSVSFKFLNDTKSELYKNVKIYIDDGIDRPLTEKGTGIQSAVIIALFSQYCELFHNTSSLLITEEPEIFLHPHARRVLSAELNKYLIANSEQQRQLVLSTHSPEFLKNVEPQNIIRVFKDKNKTLISQISKSTADSIGNDIKRLIWSQNAEIFFADKVVLVEGGEVYLLPSIVDKIRNEKQSLDYNDITVARINGKGNFTAYAKMLNEMQISWLILGDLDCYKSDVASIVRDLKITDLLDPVIKIQTVIRKIKTDYKKIKDRVNKIYKNTDAQILKSVFEKIIDKSITPENEELQAVVAEMQDRYKEKNYLNAIIESGIKKEFVDTQKKLREHNIFIWSRGELEDYYTEKVNEINGSKDIKALELSYIISDEKVNLKDYIKHIGEIKILCNKLLDKECS
jgi:putative ATP-dependent endonuclease of OLD family